MENCCLWYDLDESCVGTNLLWKWWSECLLLFDANGRRPKDSIKTFCKILEKQLLEWTTTLVIWNSLLMETHQLNFKHEITQKDNLNEWIPWNIKCSHWMISLNNQKHITSFIDTDFTIILLRELNDRFHRKHKAMNEKILSKENLCSHFHKLNKPLQLVYSIEEIEIEFHLQVHQLALLG